MYFKFRNAIHNFSNFWQSSLSCHNIGSCRTIKTIVYSNPMQKKTANLHNAQGLDASFRFCLYLFILHRHSLELNAINLVQDISEVLSRLDFGIS